jgi:tetratricopeptide (TPR) repeat protein
MAALSCYSEGRFVEGLELLELPNRPGEEAPEVHILRADFQMALGRFHDAVVNYAAGVSIDTENAYAHHRLAACLRQLKRWDRAEESYRRVLALDPGDDNARIGLGDCLLYLNRPADALACFEACHRQSESDALLFGRAVALQMLSRWEEAEALFARVLETQPQADEALANLIALNVERFDLRRVELYALRLLRHDPDSLIALQALTMVAFEHRKYEEASDYYLRWRANLAEGGAAAREDAIQYRMSRESVDRLIGISMQGRQETRSGEKRSGGDR